MAIDATDWTITRSTKVIDYTGDDHGGASPTYATVLELRRWIGGLSDDASSTGDDQHAITDLKAVERITDNYIELKNGYSITDAAAEHLYDGSVVSEDGDDIYEGMVNYGNSSVQIQCIRNGSVLTDDYWNYGGAGLNADAAQGISHRFLIKVRESGADIDGRRLVWTTRTFGKTPDEFPINGTNRGNNTIALSDADDPFNNTLEATVATWTTITNTEGYRAIDVNADGTDEHYYSEWNRDSYTIGQFMERMKWLTRDGSASTLYGLNGELFRGITHEVSLTTPRSGSFSAVESVSWGSGATAGTGQMLAIDSVSAGTAMWIQLLTGVAPSASVTITGGSGASATNTGTPTERTVPTPFFGVSTGTSIIGGFGFGVEASDLAVNDKVRALDNVQYSPKNNQTFSLLGLVSGEDYAVVTPWDGSTTDGEGNPAMEKDKFSLNTTLNGASETSVVITTAIPTWLPSSGTTRVVTDGGTDKLCSYTSFTGSTFTITSEDFSSDNATAGNDVFPTPIDTLASGSTESFTGVYTSDEDLVVLVRDGGVTPIKDFITSAAFGSAGGSVTVIRTSDA